MRYKERDPGTYNRAQESEGKITRHRQSPFTSVYVLSLKQRAPTALGWPDKRQCPTGAPELMPMLGFWHPLDLTPSASSAEDAEVASNRRGPDCNPVVSPRQNCGLFIA